MIVKLLLYRPLEESSSFTLQQYNLSVRFLLIPLSPRPKQALVIKMSREPLLKRKAQYGWPPHQDRLFSKTRKDCFSMKRRWSKLVGTRRSAVLILPFPKGARVGGVRRSTVLILPFPKGARVGGTRRSTVLILPFPKGFPENDLDSIEPMAIAMIQYMSGGDSYNWQSVNYVSSFPVKAVANFFHYLEMKRTKKKWKLGLTLQNLFITIFGR